MNNYKGEIDTLTLSPGVALTSGGVYDIGSGVLGVAVATTASTDPAAVQMEGVFRVSKVSGAIASTIHTAAEAWSASQIIYWDQTNSVATTKAVGSRMGIARDAAASGDAYGYVVMDALNTPQAPIVVTAVLRQSLNSTIGTHTLPGGKIPSGYVPISYMYYVNTTFTSATDAATIALGVETDDTDALKAATAISSGTTWDATGAPIVAAPAAGVKTADERSLVAVIAVEALTAGVLTVSAVCIHTGA